LYNNLEGGKMEKLIGKITHYFGKISVGIIKIEDGELNVGDTIHIKGHTSDFTQQVGSIQIEHEQIQKAKKGDDIGIKVDQKVHEHDEVYLVTE
jgi:putative protease